MTDEQCIAMALLHGCEFYYAPPAMLWYVSSGWGRSPALVQLHRDHKERTGWVGFKTREALARAYCKHFNLIEEVTDEQLR